MVAPHPRHNLEICLVCERDFVQPIESRGAVNQVWFALKLWCANCGWEEEGAYLDLAVEALDEVRGRHMATMQAHAAMLAASADA